MKQQKDTKKIMNVFSTSQGYREKIEGGADINNRKLLPDNSEKRFKVIDSGQVAR